MSEPQRPPRNEKRAMRKASGQQEYNALLLQFAAELISMVPSELEAGIASGLKTAGEFWGLDRIVIVEVSEEGRDAKVLYSYLSPGISLPLSHNDDTTPWLMERIRAGDTLVLSFLPDDLPEYAEVDRQYCLREGVRSSLVLPFQVGDSIKGGVIFSSIRTNYSWSEDVKRQLHCLAQILASAIARKFTASSIGEARKFEQLLSEVSAKYINLPLDEIEQAARGDFGRLSRLLGVDRCVLMRFGDDVASWMVPTYEWEKTAWWPEEDSVRALSEWKDDPEVIADLQYIFAKWKRGDIFRVDDAECGSEDAARTKKLHSALGVKSVITVPILISAETVGSIGVATTRAKRVWPDEIVPKLRLFGEVFMNALRRKQYEESLLTALKEVKELKASIEADYTYLREEIDAEQGFATIIGKSEPLRKILRKVKHVAPTDVTVLILGETGTGKGLIARAIHNISGRSERPFVQVNCAALAPSLVESELFGHEKGAFTGAHSRSIGRFELANGSTLFLDEIGDLPLGLQAKLLRVLQDGEFERVGGSSTIRTNVRVIAATNKDLQKEVEGGRFRQDLWYRLNVFPMVMPPLRERREDISLLVRFFAEKHGKRIGKNIDRVSSKTVEALGRHSWPGNIRELENLVERAVIHSTSRVLEVEIPDVDLVQERRARTLEEIEREHILETLEYTYWKIEGQNGAARILGLNPSTLRQRIKKHRIERPDFKTRRH